MAELFDMKLRALRRDRAARQGPEFFLLERAFADCLERVELMQQHFTRALLIGCPDPAWPSRLGAVAGHVDVRDPGALFASKAGGSSIAEDDWQPEPQAYDLIMAIGTLDTVNDLPLGLRLLRGAMTPGGLLIGALSGGETLPLLRGAMRAADAISGIAAPHVHPRIEPAALSPLLSQAGLAKPVVDVDRVQVSYRSFDRLVVDLRRMGATNILAGARPPVSRSAREAAIRHFAAAAVDGRSVETFELLHFAAWSPQNG